MLESSGEVLDGGVHRVLGAPRTVDLGVESDHGPGTRKRVEHLLPRRARRLSPRSRRAAAAQPRAGSPAAAAAADYVENM